MFYICSVFDVYLKKKCTQHLVESFISFLNIYYTLQNSNSFCASRHPEMTWGLSSYQGVTLS